jgi:hypothetical protein
VRLLCDREQAAVLKVDKDQILDQLLSVMHEIAGPPNVDTERLSDEKLFFHDD